MAFYRKKADEAANAVSLAHDCLMDAELHTLADAAAGLLERLEAVLEGDSPMPGDFE